MPVLFDKTACTDKAVRLIAECARSGAELIVFPELFIPGYPYGMTFGFTVVDTPWGPMGSLICWESYMPLARTALYEKSVTLYISPNTNDNPEWQATVQDE